MQINMSVHKLAFLLMLKQPADMVLEEWNALSVDDRVEIVWPLAACDFADVSQLTRKFMDPDVVGGIHVRRPWAVYRLMNERVIDAEAVPVHVLRGYILWCQGNGWSGPWLSHLAQLYVSWCRRDGELDENDETDRCILGLCGDN